MKQYPFTDKQKVLLWQIAQEVRFWNYAISVDEYQLLKEFIKLDSSGNDNPQWNGLEYYTEVQKETLMSIRNQWIRYEKAKRKAT